MIITHHLHCAAWTANGYALTITKASCNIDDSLRLACRVVVRVTAGAHLQHAQSDLTFVLKRKDIGRKKGALMTASLRKM